ncbi:MAG: efflux RND transporter periplasmic adaptor subunit [Dehalococcoidales bacterium]|nr:efflux RND transporter periplasmic adaptor subunit [Dehalococcoidales bacterium]
MKKLKILAAVFMIGALVLLSVSCSGSEETTTATTRTATVERGDLTVSITGTGNLAYSKTEELAFEMAGYVEEVLVSEGDTVAKGDEIARLNTSDWEDDIKTLTKALTRAQRSLTSAQEAVTKAERNLNSAKEAVTTAQRAVSSKVMSVESAELDLKVAEYNLGELEDVKAAKDIVDAAEDSINLALAMRRAGDDSIDSEYIADLQEEYDTALARLERIKKGADTTVSSDVALQIEQYQFNIEKAKKAIEDAEIAVEDAKTAVLDAQLDQEDADTAVSEAKLDLADAELEVSDAQSDLEDTENLSPIIKAPFDGFITNVKVSGGDEVYKGTVAAIISDPEQFEAEILVTEYDISMVELGGEAQVSLDALSDVTYPAEITFISPTATVSSGVVNFNVTVALTSLEPVSTDEFSMMQPPSGAMPPDMPQGIPPAAGDSSSGTAAGPAETSTTTAVTLKEGLSATVEIIDEQAIDVLYVPSRAITTQGPRSFVQVVNGTETEIREVTVGMTDGSDTEIQSGLSEGEVVSYTTGSSSTSSSSSSGGVGMGMMGGGGVPPPGGF